MASPPASPNVPLHGSSRTTGGISRGRAFGNHLNAADLAEAHDISNVPVQGTVRIYFSEINPSLLSPEHMAVSATIHSDVEQNGNIVPVLRKVGRRFSPVSRE